MIRKADGAFVELDSETHSPTPTFIHHCWNLCNLVKFFGFLWENAAPPVIHCCDNCSPDKLPWHFQKILLCPSSVSVSCQKKPGQIVLKVTFVIVQQPEEEYWSLLSNRGGGNKNRFSTAGRWVQLCICCSTWGPWDYSCTARYVWSDSALPQAWRGGGALTTKPKTKKLWFDAL